MGILGPRLYKYKTDDVVFDGGEISSWMQGAKHSNISHAQNLNPRSVDYITGASLLIKREVIEKIGLLREQYFLYYEDVDWCIRARRWGYQCVIVPKSKVWHKVSASSKEGSAPYIYYHTRNRLMLARLNGNILQKIMAYCKGAWILAKQYVKFFAIPQRRNWARPMMQGVSDFYKGHYGTYENRN